MSTNPYKTYQQQSVMTMTSGDLLIALYDGMLKELCHAKRAFALKNYAEINRRLQKVQLMIRHLKSTLDFHYEIAGSLNDLYDYLLDEALKTNLKKDPEKLEELIDMISELRDCFYQAYKKTRTIAAIS